MKELSVSHLLRADIAVTMPRGQNSQVIPAPLPRSQRPRCEATPTPEPRPRRCSQGNTYNTPGGTNSSDGSSYHYSNNDGSYYYANDNGSTYYKTPPESSAPPVYTPPPSK